MSANENQKEDAKESVDEDMMQFSAWKMSANEFGRLVFMMALIVLCFAPDWGAIRTMTYVVGVFLGVALIAHITRKYSLFPYLDMRDLYNRSRKTPLSSSIVFAAVSGIIIACIMTAAQFFARGG